MGRSKRTKIFEINEKKYRFDCSNFIFIFEEYCVKEKISKTKLQLLLSEKINVSSDAIHNWLYKLNGPVSIELIVALADFFSLDSYFQLLYEVKEQEIERNAVGMYSNLQIESLKRVYDAIIEFLHEFYKTGGFTTALWYEFYHKGVKDPVDAIYDYVENQLDKVHLVLQKECFYLHNTKIYEELEYYCDNDLYDTFDGKLDYAYRFEAYAEGNPTTEDDYNKALNRINTIMKDCIYRIQQ